MELGWSTDTGQMHPINEDSFALFPAQHGVVLLVCDGMGGMGRGDEASQLAVRTAFQFLRHCEMESSAAIDEALRRADYSIRRLMCVSEDDRPGCTAACAYVTSDGVQIGWVGDSPVHWFRSGELLRRTRDDKLVEDLIDQGTLSREEAMASPIASVLTKALGGRPVSALPLSASLMPDLWQLKQGDHLVLCSDGLSDLVSPREMAELVESLTPPAAADALVALANARGGHDNITVIVGRAGGETELDGPVSSTDLHAFTESMDDHRTDPHGSEAARATLPPDLFTTEPAPRVADSPSTTEPASIGAHGEGVGSAAAPPEPGPPTPGVPHHRGPTDGQIVLTCIAVTLALFAGFLAIAAP